MQAMDDQGSGDTHSAADGAEYGYPYNAWIFVMMHEIAERLCLGRPERLHDLDLCVPLVVAGVRVRDRFRDDREDARDGVALRLR
jgi:hypothetical protein